MQQTMSAYHFRTQRVAATDTSRRAELDAGADKERRRRARCRCGFIPVRSAATQTASGNHDRRQHRSRALDRDRLPGTARTVPIELVRSQRRMRSDGTTPPTWRSAVAGELGRRSWVMAASLEATSCHEPDSPPRRADKPNRPILARIQPFTPYAFPARFVPGEPIPSARAAHGNRACCV